MTLVNGVSQTQPRFQLLNIYACYATANQKAELKSPGLAVAVSRQCLLRHYSTNLESSIYLLLNMHKDTSTMEALHVRRSTIRLSMRVAVLQYG